MRETLEFVQKAAEASTDFELTNNQLKIQYFVNNIKQFQNMTSFISQSKGTFGTGYPFYVLDKNLEGSLPIINEQLRYNNELAQAVLLDKEQNHYYREWRCASCLSDNAENMPDLKTICNKCPNVDPVFKPRKVINRLPDIDMWMVVSSDDISIASAKIKKGLYEFGFSTSDVNPVKSIYDVQEIANKLKAGEMPQKLLPIDSHIIEDTTLFKLISDMPDVLEMSKRNNEVPYLPIHPLSLRKTWQKDDNAYNFVYDYLASFTEFTMDDQIQNMLNTTREYIANQYTTEELFGFLLSAGPDSAKRRHIAPELKENFYERIETWKEL